MSDPDLNLLQVANRGILLVALITKFLSALPHPIEVLEDHIACISVTSSLLQTLDTTITKYHSSSKLCAKSSFTNPLCKDILLAFNYFGKKVQEAKALKVFEPNEVGLVKVPGNAWCFVMGGEQKMRELRNRLFVEKYRVRVLIDAVAWFGLKGLPNRSVEQDRELEGLRRMAPLLAERLVGVWKDYRLRIGNGAVENVVVSTVQEVMVVEKKEPVVVVVKEVQDECDLKKEVKFALHPSSSTTSIESSCSTTSTTSTITDDSIQELWVLRLNAPKKSLKSQTRVLGLTLSKIYEHTPGWYYVKPLPSHPSEIQGFMRQQARDNDPVPQKAVLALPDDAQKEVQKLLEARRSACSNDTVKRSFEISGFSTRPRRDITPLNVAKGKRWWKKEKIPMEWVFVLKGETVDCLKRSTPVKHEDAWNPKVKEDATENAEKKQTENQQAQVAVAMATAGTGNHKHVLRHVEVRRGVSIQEAEARMEELCKSLIVSENRNTKVGPEKDEKDEKFGRHQKGETVEDIIQN